MAITRDFPLSPTPESTTDSVDVAKEKSGYYADKGFKLRDGFFKKPNYKPKDITDFNKKNQALSDSSNKYSEIVFGSTKNMSKKDLASKGIKRTISAKGDTTMNYNSKGVNFTRNYYNKNK